MTTVAAYGAQSPTSGLAPLNISRRQVGPRDVHISIDYCGLCHSDVHTVRGEWGQKPWPIAPGHEIVGRVKEAGSDTPFAVGDAVAVGCMVNSCLDCSACSGGLEQYCERGFTSTYGDIDADGSVTQGGYSQEIVVDKHFVLALPQSLDPAAAAPLLCAGITTFSPLKHWEAGSRRKDVGVIGLGGLGHMGVKLAQAFGANVSVFTRNSDKVEDARALGADRVVLTSDQHQFSQAASTLDLILNTVAAAIDLTPYMATLRTDGVLVQLGAPGVNLNIDPSQFIGKRLQYGGSLIGGIAETQEMLDFCAQHKVTADIEMVEAQQLNEAYDRMVAGDVKYRFVLDNSTLVASQAPM